MRLSPDLEQRLRDLVRVFLAENATINLSALRTEEACWIGNILDSLAFLDIVPSLSTVHSPLSTLMDVGTGGGFPLLPIAIAAPDLRCVGLDAVGKKIRAIDRMIAQLKISNSTTVTGRSEEIAQKKEHRERYDAVTSRAVAPLSVLLEYTVPFARTGGAIILWKSLHIDDELAASKRAQDQLRCTLEKSHRYALPGDFLAGHSSNTRSDGWGERQLLVFRKKETTPGNVPRPVGMAKKAPL